MTSKGQPYPGSQDWGHVPFRSDSVIPRHVWQEDPLINYDPERDGGLCTFLDEKYILFPDDYELQRSYLFGLGLDPRTLLPLAPSGTNEIETSALWLEVRKSKNNYLYLFLLPFHAAVTHWDSGPSNSEDEGSLNDHG